MWVNGGIISKAMLSAGYSKETSKRTDKLTKKKGWIELMEQNLPDSLLAKKHKALLNKTEKIAKNNNATKEIEVIERKDHPEGRQKMYSGLRK